MTGGGREEDVSIFWTPAGAAHVQVAETPDAALAVVSGIGSQVAAK